MSQNFRHETNTFTLPTTGTPVTVLTFNPSSLQYARVQISGGTALWIGDGVGGDGLPLQNGVAITFTGGEYRGDSDPDLRPGRVRAAGLGSVRHRVVCR